MFTSPSSCGSVMHMNQHLNETENWKWFQYMFLHVMCVIGSSKSFRWVNYFLLNVFYFCFGDAVAYAGYKINHNLMVSNIFWQLFLPKGKIKWVYFTIKNRNIYKFCFPYVLLRSQTFQILEIVYFMVDIWLDVNWRIFEKTFLAYTQSQNDNVNLDNLKCKRKSEKVVWLLL